MSAVLIINILNYLLALSFIAGIAAYGKVFFSPEQSTEKMRKTASLFLKLIIFVHIVYFAVRSITYHHAPITNPFELMTLLAFGLTVTYFYIEYKTGVYQTGFFILLIAGIFQIVSTILIRELAEINPVLKSWLLGVHVSTALVGYSAIILSGIYGYLYLNMYRSIKQNKPSNFYKKLPSLHLLEKLAASSIQFGFFFLTFTILIGIIWLPLAIKEFSYTDPKLIATLVVWIVYALGFASIKIYRTQSKTTMKLALLGFIFAMCSVFVVNFVFESFHKFY
jgi:ABC-type transport system involved in cytochrome c biogenesis permease subunit